MHNRGTHIPEWTFGDRLRKVRRDAGLTGDEMAARLGVPKGRYQAWEANRSHPRGGLADISMRVEQETGVSAVWMAGFPGRGR